jgi:hypothetical protein
MTLTQPRLLWGLIGCLALLLALEWVWPESAPPPIAARPVRHAASTHAADMPQRDTDAWGETILARPLFSVSRRPPKIATNTGHAAAPSDARLAGILITPYGRRAIFAPETGKQLVLAEGAPINESTIRQIRADRVILASGAELRPSFDRRPGALGTTANFQPGFPAPGFPAPGFQPGFPAPGFPNPGFQPGQPNPGFPNPGFQNPGFQNPGFQPGLQPQPNPPEDGQPQPGVPFRNPLIPQRRE